MTNSSLASKPTSRNVGNVVFNINCVLTKEIYWIKISQIKEYTKGFEVEEYIFSVTQRRDGW